MKIIIGTEEKIHLNFCLKVLSVSFLLNLKDSLSETETAAIIPAVNADIK